MTSPMSQEILNYKRFGSDDCLSDEEIPKTAQNRRMTDKYFLIVFVAFIVLLIPFLIYTLYYSDIRRINGYDKCGNICGVKNVKYNQWNCTGIDMTDKPIFKNGDCKSRDDIKYRSNNITQDHYGLNENFELDDAEADEYLKNITMYIEKVGWKIALSSFLCIGYCIILVILLRYATAALVWGILLLSWTCLLLITVFLWSAIGSDASSGALCGAIFISITVVILLCIMIFMQKKIRLVIMLIKESAKAVFDMNSIFSIPVMTVSVVLIITIACAVSTIFILCSGILTEDMNRHLTYLLNSSMVFTLAFNIIMATWTIQFIGGIQYMIMSGAISKWYFTGNKELLGSPILTSALIAFKFHLGTIALGSLIITIVSIIRGVLLSLERHPRLRLLIRCCMGYIEGILKFFTNNSYIVTAIHGTSFLQSGKQAVKLIALNICNTIVVNRIEHFVLGMAHVLILCLSILTTFVLLLGEENKSDYSIYAYLIVGFIAAICSWTILGTFQTAVDTMFLCFCEDCLINDGISKPYAMSRGFMEFVESSKKSFEKQIQEKGLPTL